MNSDTVLKTDINISQNVHPRCVICGAANPRGLHMEFYKNGDGGVKASFQCEKHFEGYPGMMHGGITSSILDGAMGNCMFAHGLATVTVEMTIKYREPLLIGRSATVSARIIRTSHTLHLLEAEIIQDGKVKATAKGKYYEQPQLANKAQQFSYSEK